MECWSFGAARVIISPMNETTPAKPVERLFPFVLRARALLIGRDTLWRSRRKLQFVLITEDISENSRVQILHDFAPYPIVQRYTPADLEKHFGVKGAKVIGFAKSTLASSIYAELKQWRINKPAKLTPDPSKEGNEQPGATDGVSPQTGSAPRRG